MADLGNLIEDVWFKKFLGSVTIPRQWNNQENGDNWITHYGKGHEGNIQANGVFSSAFTTPKVPDPYSLPTGNGTVDQTAEGKGW